MTKNRFYLTAITVCAFIMSARTPGGVEGANAWFITAPVSNNLMGDYHWLDLSGDSIISYRLDAKKGKFPFKKNKVSIGHLNFNPAIIIDSKDLVIQTTLPGSGLLQSTIIGVFSPSDISGAMSLYNVFRSDSSCYAVTNDRILGNGSHLGYGESFGENLRHTGSNPVSEEDFGERRTKILTHYSVVRPNTSIWGDSNNASIKIMENSSAKSFSGYMPEMIAFSRMLSPFERRKVESYLAVKYGITLNSSYFDASGNIMWDQEESGPNHNRIAGVARSVASGFSQSVSSTSYEEGRTKPKDSYYMTNPYGMSSESSLLVMGREYGNAMPDNSFLLWGDDNGELKTYTSPADSSWHIMERTWLLRTNTPTVIDSVSKRWIGTGITVVPDGFNDIMRLEAGMDGCVRTPCLKDNLGFIELRCPVSYPTFDMGFTSKDSHECMFGFQFHSDGKVFKIANGETGDKVHDDIRGRHVAISFSEGSVCLRIDGIGSYQNTVLVPRNLQTGEFRGIITAEASSQVLQIPSIRFNGAFESGYMAELSHILTPEKEFRTFRKGRTVILIDPSGDGVFNPGDVRIIPCSEPDFIRGKTVFRNVPWDSDGNGRDMFTFAYFDGLLADVKAVPTTCLASVPQKDGAIDINIRIGTPVYRYTLKADDVSGVVKDSVIADGFFHESSHRIDRLATGSYDLTIRQGGGNDIYALSDGKAELNTEDNIGNRIVEWTVTDNGSYKAYINIGIHSYHMDVDGNSVLVYNGSKLERTETIRPGDILGFEKSGSYIRFRLNHDTFHTTMVPDFIWKGPELKFTFYKGISHIAGLSVDGRPFSKISVSGNVYVETPLDREVSYHVNIGNGCDASLPNGIDPIRHGIQAMTAESRPTVADHAGARLSVRQDTRLDLTFDAELDTPDPGPASLAVFDASGRLMYLGDMEGDDIKKIRFSVPVRGVYIVKAFTGENEYSRKILAR